MVGKRERTIDELYQDDPERADAVVFGRRTGATRRGFLGGAGLAAMGAAVGGTIVFGDKMPAGWMPTALAQGTKDAPSTTPPAPKGPQPLQFPGKDPGLVVLGERPLVAETPEHLLDDETTPTPKFFIRNNGLLPEATKEPDAWKITVDGEVDTKLELTLGELKKRFTPVTRRMVMECGGNGRSFFTPQARGNQWTNGGAGCAEWTGVKVADVLKAAGVKPSAVFSGHYGADPHLSGDATRQAVSRGVPIKKLMDDNNLIVWAMNGQPLLPVHGFPVRLVIPGWPGSVSEKWLTRIWVRDKVHDGQGMGGTSYRVAIKPMVPGGKPDPANFTDLESMPVRADHHQPRERRQACRRNQGDRAARRRLGRRPHCAGRRPVDRLRQHVAERHPRPTQRILTIGSAGRRPLDCPATAISRCGRARPTRVGSRSRMWPVAGTRRATEPIRCTASPSWSDKMALARLPLRRLAAGACALAAALLVVALPARDGTGQSEQAQSKQAKPQEEQPEHYPDGPNREDTFYFCTACHGFKLVAAQGMSRVRWNETFDVMVSRHKMPERPGRGACEDARLPGGRLPRAQAARRLEEPVRARVKASGARAQHTCRLLE